LQLSLRSTNLHQSETKSEKPQKHPLSHEWADFFTMVFFHDLLYKINKTAPLKTSTRAESYESGANHGWPSLHKSGQKSQCSCRPTEFSWLDHGKKQNFESTSALKDVNHTPRPNQDDPMIQGSCD